MGHPTKQRIKFGFHTAYNGTNLNWNKERLSFEVFITKKKSIITILSPILDKSHICHNQELPRKYFAIYSIGAKISYQLMHYCWVNNLHTGKSPAKSRSKFISQLWIYICMQSKQINLRIYNNVTTAAWKLTWKKPESTITKHNCLTTSDKSIQKKFIFPHTIKNKTGTSRIQCRNSDEWNATFIIWLTNLTSKQNFWRSYVPASQYISKVQPTRSNVFSIHLFL